MLLKSGNFTCNPSVTSVNRFYDRNLGPRQQHQLNWFVADHNKFPYEHAHSVGALHGLFTHMFTVLWLRVRRSERIEITRWSLRCCAGRGKLWGSDLKYV